MEPLLKVKDVAQLLNISTHYLRKLLVKPENDIPYRRVGKGKQGHYRFLKSELEAWAAKGLVQVDRRTIHRRPS